MVFNERDAVNLDVVDLGAELDPLVLLAAHYRADVRTVDRDDAAPDFLFVEMIGLLAADFQDCQVLIFVFHL